MEVLVSGAAGAVAVVGRTPELRMLGGQTYPIRANDAGLIFSGCFDVERRNVQSVAEADALKRDAWAKDRALRILLMLFDPDEQADDLPEYASLVEKLFSSASVADFVLRRLYSSPLVGVDMERLSSALLECPSLRDLIESLKRDQAEIRTLHKSLMSLDAELFEDARSRAIILDALAATGAIFDLVQARRQGKSVDFIVLQMVSRLRHVDGARAVIDAWTSGIRESRTRLALAMDELDEEVFEDSDRSNTGAGGRQAFENAILQQKAIVGRLKERDIDGARKFADELIATQSRVSNPEHIGKSLSRLSHQAKILGVPELQIEWAEKAVTVNPADPLTHAHLADALIGAGRYTESAPAIQAMESLGRKLPAEIARARILRAAGRMTEAREKYIAAAQEFRFDGEVLHALAGAADVLRDMGQYDLALAEYKNLLSDYPLEGRTLTGLAMVYLEMGNIEDAIAFFGRAAKVNDGEVRAIAKNGRAKSNKLAGNFAFANQLYDEVIAEFPNNWHALCGKADVFRAGGNLEQALIMYDVAIGRAPFVPMPVNGKIEILKELGKYSEALALSRAAVRQFPDDQQLASNYAGLLKAKGSNEEALALYDQHVGKFPYDYAAKLSRADVYKRMRRWEDALSAYEDILRTAPRYESAIAAKAALLIFLSRFSEAEKLLPAEKPTSQAGWNRYYLRAALSEAKGDTKAARQMLLSGIRDVPFARQRRVMKAALARLELSAGRAHSALRIVEPAPNEIANVIRFHALAASGRMEPARSVLKEIQSAENSSQYAELVVEIGKTFNLIAGRPSKPAAWIFRNENDFALLEAA